ncbi:hypothetical protein E2562_024282 [Oryza meyeriana var. granulata]|uniref:Uncharacterized protein n=1 Tax=Oryza meyeriana var. granulata TaxID=110450 RepID=A0A6G1C8U0_9ORYZ|nr:hypothetical protein E2562_024282 [Oryza meyeriana var. granulata]
MTLASNPAIRRHEIWQAQPVGQFRDTANPSLPDGATEPPTPLSKFHAHNRLSSSGTPATWMTTPSSPTNYVEDDENMFRFNYLPSSTGQ